MVVLVSLARGPCLPLALPHDHHGRADDAVAEGVALLHDGDDLALLARRFADRFMHLGVEGAAVGLDLSDAGVLQDRLELAIDEPDAIDPGEAGQLGIDGAQRALQVVDERQQVEDQRGVREAAGLGALLLDAALEVLVVGGGALP